MILGGLALVTAAYCALNVAYVAVLGGPAAAATDTVAVAVAQAAARALSPHLPPSAAAAAAAAAPVTVALGVAVSVAGTLNGSVMTGGRALFAAARAGALPAPLAHLSAATGAPCVALLAQGVWSAALLAAAPRAAAPGGGGGALEALLTFSGAAAWLCYAAVAAALLALRRQQPHLPRPFLVPLYPLLPAGVVLLGVALAGGTALRQPRAAAAVAALFAAGAGVHAAQRCCGAGSAGRPRRPSRNGSRVALAIAARRHAAAMAHIAAEGLAAAGSVTGLDAT
jgi:APA family basic amino acid/polyamine antiporter